jgi:hypothetical protein
MPTNITMHDSDEHSTSKLHFSSSSFGTSLIMVTAAEGLGPEFSIETWPVADRCKGSLEDLVSSHDIQPLPAYNEKHVLIPPFGYESKLKGALIEVHMVFYHHRIKRTKWNVFNAVLRELIVLRLLAAMPKSPIKRPRLNSGPSTEQQRKKRKTKNH